jgi:carbon-monoxide dehydrogenase iron sulfur subunit
MISVDNPERCTGCLICELACSLHHTGEFSRSRASIKVNKSISNPKKGTNITINFRSDDKRPVCDLCKGKPLPLCVTFCPEKIIGISKGD